MPGSGGDDGMMGMQSDYSSGFMPGSDDGGMGDFDSFMPGSEEGDGGFMDYGDYWA